MTWEKPKTLIDVKKGPIIGEAYQCSICFSKGICTGLNQFFVRWNDIHSVEASVICAKCYALRKHGYNYPQGEKYEKKKQRKKNETRRD